MNPSVARAVAGALLVAGCVLPAGGSADPLQERILDSKYTKGDYALYFGWHDPADWQFDEHASYALPVGVKVRLRWLQWLQVEAELSYFRRSRSPIDQVSLYRQPSFDSFSTGVALQLVPLRHGPVRPYVGGGPIFVSLGNDFVAFRPDVYDVAPDNYADQYVFASWGLWDVGWQAMGGLDFPFSGRVFPFVEFRALFGEASFDAKDVKLGSITLEGIGLEVSDLETAPALDQRAAGGRPHEGRFDWSGPSVSVGLKIRF